MAVIDLLVAVSDGVVVRGARVLDYRYEPGVKTIRRGDPLDDQIGCPDAITDMTVVWEDTGATFDASDWDRYGETVENAVRKELGLGER